MRKWIPLLVVLVIFNACSKVNVDEELPEWEHLEPHTIETHLPRVNIEADPNLLVKMMARYAQEIIIPATIYYYNTSGELEFTENSKIEIKGVGSAAEPMKPIGINFDHSVSNDQFQMVQPKVLGNGDYLHQFQNIRLRNSGQDYGVTMIKDLAYTELAIRAGMDLEVKYGTPAHVFINNQYYGLHNIRTENDQLALSYLLQVDSSQITTIKMDDSNFNLEYREGNEAVADALIAAIKQEDATAIKSLLDIDNFLDYIIFEDYAGNIDWPHNNARAYSVNGGKFRFLLYDLDLVAFRTKNPILPEMEYKDDHLSRILQILHEDDHDFIEKRLHERQEMWYNRLSPQLFNEIVDELAGNIELDIKYLIARRGVPESTLQWRINLEQLKRDFERTDHFNRKKYDIED